MTAPLVPATYLYTGLCTGDLTTSMKGTGRVFGHGALNFGRGFVECVLAKCLEHQIFKICTMGPTSGY